MSYTKAPTRHYLGARDFGTGSSILLYIKGPLGKGGQLVDYGICNIEEAFVAATLHPGMQVGTVSDEDAYGDLVRFTSAAIAEGCYSVLGYFAPGSAGYNALMVNRSLPKDTVIMVTLEEGTGGSDTGQATPFVDIIWDD